MEQKRKKTARKSKRKDDTLKFMNACVVAICIYFMYHIILTNIIGDLGIGYYSIAITGYVLILSFLSAGIPFILAKTMSFRMGKGSLQNVKQVFQNVFVLEGALGLVCSIVLALLAGIMAKNIFGQPLMQIVIRFLCPAVTLFTIAQLLRGYFQGFGTYVPTAVSMIIEQICALISSLLFAYLFSKEGQQVGTFLHDEHYEAAYAAAGASLGISIGLIMAILFMGFLYLSQDKTVKKAIQKDTSVKRESTGFMVRSFILSMLPVSMLLALLQIGKFIVGIFYQNWMTNQKLIEEAAIYWGAFIGKYHLLMMIPNMFSALAFFMILILLRNKYQKEEMYFVKEQIAYRMKMAVLIGFFFMGFYIAISQTLVDFFFVGERVLPIQMLRFGGVTLGFTAISCVAGGFLFAFGHDKLLIRNVACYAGLYVISGYLFVLVLKIGIMSFIYAELIASVAFAIANLWTLQKKLRYRQEYRKTFFLPLGAALILGVVLTLLQLLLKNCFPGLILLLCIMIGIPIYFISIFALKTYQEEELQHGLFGQRLIAIAKKCRLM